MYRSVYYIYKIILLFLLYFYEETTMSFSVEGKVALVTGANRGIGKAIVESFVNHGVAKVYLAVRNLDSASELVEKFGDKVSPIFVDVSQAESIKELAKGAQDVNVVVNNAGVLEIADPLSENMEEAFTKELNINVFGLIRMAQAFTPIIEKNGGGAFVQLNSVASITNFLGFTSYCASKSAAYSITQGLKDSVADKGIHVLSVHPGPIATDMAAKAGFDEGDTVQSVSEGIVASLKAGDFHLFPDVMAKEIESAYDSFAKNIIEAPMQEG